MVAKIVSIINLKGGVGKTTTTVMLSECLVDQFGKKVLVIDLDPQTNATVALIGEDAWELADNDKKTIFYLFQDKLEKSSDFDLNGSIIKGVSNLNLQNLHLLPSSIKFIDIQDKLGQIATKDSYTVSPMEVLKQALTDSMLNYYDYILIDCPPNLGLITQNGIEISDYYLIPTIPDRLSTYGISQIIKRINKLRNDRKLKIECLGLVIRSVESLNKT